MGFISGLTEASLREIGRRTRLRDMVFTIGRMEESMKGIGIKIICMDRDCISGLMADNMKDLMSMIRRRDMVFTSILMADATKANGKTESNMERELL